MSIIVIFLCLELVYPYSKSECLKSINSVTAIAPKSSEIRAQRRMYVLLLNLEVCLTFKSVPMRNFVIEILQIQIIFNHLKKWIMVGVHMPFCIHVSFHFAT